MIYLIVKNFKKLILISLMIANAGCIMIQAKGVTLFREESESKSGISTSILEGIYGKKPVFFDKENKQIPVFDVENSQNGSRVSFGNVGDCGGMIGLVGIMIPIVPVGLFNTCVSDGFYVAQKWYLDFLGITLQLRYNGTTYDPYIDHDSVKFKIESFREFKKAPDKTLIIHKRKTDGSMFTKELPFDWKVVVEVSGGS